MSNFTESIVEDAALEWLQGLGYSILHGPEIAVGEMFAERSDPNYRDTILSGRLKQALAKLNPELLPEALEDAYRKLTRIDAPSLIERNRAFHPEFPIKFETTRIIDVSIIILSYLNRSKCVFV
ncbi:MAG: hypothetical protein L6428_08830 [Candidatus Aminicenantes bacterium]|nr:hypothetical protein [Acidobacteriota bacterium]MCG2811549.1 hypothetical protein [Candidatus Aminicenantes bacterium]